MEFSLAFITDSPALHATYRVPPARKRATNWKESVANGKCASSRGNELRFIAYKL